MAIMFPLLQYCMLYSGIRADVIVYIFAPLHTALRTEANMLDIMNWLEVA